MNKECYRGIAKKEYIYRNTTLYNDAFQFDKNQNRTDNYDEMSINWNDSEESLKIVMNQRKRDGEIQFKGGVACINIKELKNQLRDFINTECFKFERSPISNEEGEIINPYHGNFLIDVGAKNNIRVQIKSLIGSAVTEVFENTNIK